MVSHTVWILVRNECLSFETFISFEGHCKADCKADESFFIPEKLMKSYPYALEVI